MLCEQEDGQSVGEGKFDTPGLSDARRSYQKRATYNPADMETEAR